MISLKSSFFLLIFLILLTSYNPVNLERNKSIFFPIKTITLEELKLINENQLINKLEPLKNKSLFFLQKKWIKDITNEFKYISNISVKKIYPDTIKIKIIEKEPIAVQVVKKKKLYITKNGEIIEFINSKSYQNLPLVFGNQKNFNIFLDDIKKINFDISIIKAFYYFDIGRWDIELLNNKIIKLPEKNYVKSLENYILISKNKDFKKYKTFDYRITDQLILK